MTIGNSIDGTFRRYALAAGLAAAMGLVPAAVNADDQAMVVPDTGTAAPDGFALTYDVYTGGLRAIRFDFGVDLGDPGYKTRIRLETSGIVGALFKWSLEASSEGDWQDGIIVPRQYRSANVWRGRQRQVAIEYDAGIADTVTAEPPYGADDLKRVAPEMISGAVDPTTAVTALVLTSAVAGACRARTPVYDGRRRYDANMSVLEPRELKPSSAAPFAGRAEGCRLTFERIAGFKPDRKRMQDLEVAIWLADIGVASGRMPVRLELSTPWGDGFAHLVRARTPDGTLVFGEADDE
ncbi:MAG: hypothetical protein CL566_05505 [Alphaproteobacteria bacterium]|nr:hypothetical protein [Alphaproteobacteria bacterium]